MEILAPVGSFDALKAAVQNGADAVYLGGKNFSARASANNFDIEELKEAVKYAHIRDVYVYVTVNTLVKEEEIKDFLDYIKYLYEIDVDALILQDLGMTKLIKENFPAFELHASTQMVAHSLDDVLFLENMGFTRVVIARELNVDEIKYICDNSNVEIEVFVHGALCVSYSGSCFMSSFIGGRSGNRGRCAQPCRKTYEVFKGEEKINTCGKYLLSTKDLKTIENLDKIIDTGAYSLKIEGRMKRPQYVATIVKAYKDALNKYKDEKSINVEDSTIEDIYTIFNREFTSGYILRENGTDIMNSNTPNNIGLYVADVLDYNKKSKKLKIKLLATLKKGDGLNIGGGHIGRILIDNEIKDVAYKGQIVEIDFIEKIPVGQKIYKTMDAELMQRSTKSYDTDIENKKAYISAEIVLKERQIPILTIKDDRENIVKVTNEKIIEKALKTPTDDEKIKNSLNKLKNTPYEFKNIDIEKDKDIIIPVSILNEMRRDAVEKLSILRENINNRQKIALNYVNLRVRKSIKDIKLRVKLKNIEQLKQILDLDIDMIYYEDIKTLKEAIDLCKGYNKKLAFAMPRIIKDSDYKIVKKAIDEDIYDVLVANLGGLDLDKNIHTDYFLNVFNSETIKTLNKKAKSVCMSIELNLNEIKKATNNVDADIEGIAYGHIPLMISEYCPLGVLVRDCKKDKKCNECTKSIVSLKDERESMYKIFQDEFCRSYIYDSRAICMLERMEHMQKANMNIFRLNFTYEDDIKEITKAFIDTIENDFELTNYSKDVLDKIKSKGMYKGHYYRGVE